MKAFGIAAGLVLMVVVWTLIAHPETSRAPVSASNSYTQSAANSAALVGKLTQMQQRFTALSKDTSLMFDTEWNAETVVLVRAAEAEAKSLANKWSAKRDTLNEMAESLRVLADSLQDYDILGMATATKAFTKAADELQ